MKCYLCQQSNFITRNGQVRDAPVVLILECEACGLVALNNTDHIGLGYFENSGMHGAESSKMDAWLKQTEWDDQRRFDMVKSMLPNKRLLDFGCGAAGFVQRASNLAAEVAGIELETRVRDYWAG